jgi:hypothetical protein
MEAHHMKSPFRSIVGIVVAVIGLWLGFAILNITGEAQNLGGGEKALRIVFGIVWFTFWVGAMIYNVLNYSSRSRARKSGTERAAGAVAAAPPGEGKEVTAGFETKLRGLESLRKDGLVSEEEYKQKREELMREKW